MSELENSVVETVPSKAEQSKTLADAMADFKKKGGTIEVQPAQAEPSARKRKKSSSSVKAAVPVGSRNSGVSMFTWSGYDVKVGTRVSFILPDRSKIKQPSKDVYCEVADLGSMQLKIFVQGKQVKVPKPFGVGNGLAFGLVGAEAYIRMHLCKDEVIKQKVQSGKFLNKSTGCLTTKVCQGWDFLHLPYKGKTESVHDRFRRKQNK